MSITFFVMSMLKNLQHSKHALPSGKRTQLAGKSSFQQDCTVHIQLHIVGKYSLHRASGVVGEKKCIFFSLRLRFFSRKTQLSNEKRALAVYCMKYYPVIWGLK